MSEYYATAGAALLGMLDQAANRTTTGKTTMPFEANKWAEAQTKKFRHAAASFRVLAAEVHKLAEAFDGGGTYCGSCGRMHYNNFAQKQARDRVVGSAEGLSNLADMLERRAQEDAFIFLDQPDQVVTSDGDKP